MANFFPRWTNILPLKIAVCLGFAGASVVVGFTYYATPKAQRVGYMPSQPIPYDHALHVNQLGMDCRYCHSFVEHSGHANVPSASTCWNCHQHVRKDSDKLQPLRRAFDKDYEQYDGEPIKWVRIHQSPDYVFFNHSAHVNRGVSCESCHGKVNEMKVVYQAEAHSMGWCLDCHRNPEKHLRPLEEVYNLDYDAEDWLAENKMVHPETGKQLKSQKDLGLYLKEHWNIKAKESCWTCHR
ncbi:MAG: cytochrome C [Roseibacillus sp.]|nr:cytochrome C [Roseibacillus sp.]|tara:strand:- start:4774 stop:5490 length:717 start_codon:yes stop_codon:yes gene_type:complete